MPTLHWIGKEKVVNHHREVPFRVLEHQYHFSEENSQSTEPNHQNRHTSGNKTIHGDNLEALKSLLPEYEGKIKCIYIDPPYNTGNENWVYNDNVNHPKIKKWLNQVVGKEGEDLSRHDKWLCMMYPRLKLLHKLLADGGAIFISIDDNEQANLRLMCDEIFGNRNFIDTIIWQKNYSPKNSAKHFSSDHDYILVYTKNYDVWLPKKLPRSEDQLKRYKNPDDDPRGPWKTGDLSARNYYSEGTYEIIAPSGRVIEGPPKGNYWRYSEKKFKELDKDGRIWWGKNKDNVPAIKRFLNEVQDGIVPQTLWKYEDVGHTQEAKQEVNRILKEINFSFDTPKPVRLVTQILQIGSNKDDIILDSFAGTGTTAHAVLNLNKQDGGNRKFILIEMEDYAESITAERVKRIIQGYGENNKAVAGTGGSFDYYTLGAPLFDDEGNLNEEISIEKIRQYIWFSETRSAMPSQSGVINTLDHNTRDVKQQSNQVHQVNPTNHGSDYFIGIKDDTAYYFIYEKDSLTTLDYHMLGNINIKVSQYVIYADNCLLPQDFMSKHNIIFKKIPRDISRF